MSQLLTLSPSPPPLPPWSVDIQSPYNEAVVAQLKSMPGLRWDSSRRCWYGDRIAAEILAETLEAARVVKVRNEIPPLPPEQHFLAPTYGTFHRGLRDYQVHGAGWLARMLAQEGGGLLADEMGIGKSAQAIAAACAVGSGDILVVCPAVVRPHWENQLNLWAPPACRSRWLPPQSYESFQKLQKKEPERLSGVRTIVVDEAHYTSNPKAKRTKSVDAFVHTRDLNTIMLSGTPMTDHPSDLWSPLNILHPGRWGTKWQFEKRYCAGQFVEIPNTDPPRSYWQADGVSRTEELARRLKSVMLRRTKAEVLTELPPKIRNIVEVELPSRVQRDLLRAVALTDWSSGASVGVSTQLSEIEAFKLEAAEALVEEILRSGGRPLIYTTRKENAEKLAKTFNAPCVTGDVPAARRQAMLHDQPVGVATMYSVETGIDLITYDHEVFVGLDWIPKTMLQAEDRCHRIGQRSVVTIHYLIGIGTLDEIVRERVIERLDTFDRVVGSGDGSELKKDLGGLEEDILASIVGRVKGKKR